MRVSVATFLLAAFVSLGVVGCGGGRGGGVGGLITAAFQSTITDVEPDQLLQGLSLGLDFDVRIFPVEVTAVGVFDWQEDGLQSDHTVTIFDRDGTPVVQTVIRAGEGYLLDGYRYVDLDEPVILQPGFEGTIAVGYGPANLDRNGNVHGDLQIDPPPDFVGGSRLENVGDGRYGLDPDGFPDTPDLVYGGGPPNRYHSGSFCYRE